MYYCYFGFLKTVRSKTKPTQIIESSEKVIQSNTPEIVKKNTSVMENMMQTYNPQKHLSGNIKKKKSVFSVYVEEKDPKSF